MDGLAGELEVCEPGTDVPVEGCAIDSARTVFAQMRDRILRGTASGEGAGAVAWCGARAGVQCKTESEPGGVAECFIRAAGGDSVGSRCAVGDYRCEREDGGNWIRSSGQTNLCGSQQ